MSQEDSSEITEILAGLSNLKKTLTGLQNSIKQNHKHMTKKIKVLEKQVEKRPFRTPLSRKISDFHLNAQEPLRVRRPAGESR